MVGKKKDVLDDTTYEFLVEIKEDLESLEPDLLAMEEKGDAVDDELVNHAFRSIHSIKGGAGFIDHASLAGLGHAMENVLMQVREKELVITPAVVDALLAGFDQMKTLVDQAETSSKTDVSELENKLEQILQKKGAESGDALKIEDAAQDGKHIQTNAGSVVTLQPLETGKRFENREFTVDKHKFEKARQSKKFIYAVYIILDAAIDMEEQIQAIEVDVQSIGEILYSDTDAENLEPVDNGFFIVITTILDLPLLSQVLEVNKTRISLVGRKMTDGTVESDPLQHYHAQINGSDSINDEKYKTIETPEDQSALSGMEPQPVRQHSGQTIRVNMDLVSRLMNRAGELVLSRNQLRPFMESFAARDRNAVSMMQNLDMVTADMQETIMQMRMQPVGDLIGKYKRVVRDIARRMNKKVEFKMAGTHVEVDRNILEKLANPLTHLIRNCIDHGVESPEERLKQGKPATGAIHVKTEHQSGHVHIYISDDGAGIDPQLVLSKAFEKGLVTEEGMAGMTEKQKIGLIFMPGFSTSDEITDISGRGVGMDVVKTNIEELRGQIEIESEKGRGTQIHLTIPLTLAIVPSLIIGCGRERFAVPRTHIKEVIFLESGQLQQKVKKIAGSEVMRFRGVWLPILRLRTILEIETYYKVSETGNVRPERRKAIADRRSTVTSEVSRENREAKKDRRKTQWDATYVLVLKMGRHRFGLCVDELHDIQEVVVEPLNQYIKHLKYYSGATILGDGRVIMILDVGGIAVTAQLNFEIKPDLEKAFKPEMNDTAKPDESHNLIVFGNADKECFALPLEWISRIESIDAKGIYTSGNHQFFKMDNEAIHLIGLDQLLSTGPSKKASELFVVLPKEKRSRSGILVSKVIDTMNVDQPIADERDESGIVLGKCFVEDQMIQILNPDRLFDKMNQLVKGIDG